MKDELIKLTDAKPQKTMKKRDLKADDKKQSQIKHTLKFIKVEVNSVKK